MDFITSRIYISRHVLFNEHEFLTSQSLPTSLSSPSVSTQSSNSSFLFPFPVTNHTIPTSSHQSLHHSSSTTTPQLDLSPTPTLPTPAPLTIDPLPITSNPVSIPNPSVPNPNQSLSTPLPTILPSVPPVTSMFQVPYDTNTHPMVTRSKDGIFKPKALASKAGFDVS